MLPNNLFKIIFSILSSDVTLRESFSPLISVLPSSLPDFCLHFHPYPAWSWWLQTQVSCSQTLHLSTTVPLPKPQIQNPAPILKSTLSTFPSKRKSCKPGSLATLRIHDLQPLLESLQYPFTLFIIPFSPVTLLSLYYLAQKPLTQPCPFQLQHLACHHAFLTWLRISAMISLTF